HGFAFNWFGLFGNALVPGAFFPPAYVYEAYWILRLVGTETALAVQNLVFSLAVLVLVYEIAHFAFGRTAGGAALLVCVFFLPFFSRLTHGSPVYFKMLFMCLVLWSLLRAWRGGRARDVVAAGAWTGVLALSMPDILVYAALAAVAFVFRWRRPRLLATRL